MTERFKPRTLAGELAAEFAGTLILILFGVAVVAQVVAGGIGNHDSIAWAWGLGVTFGVYVSARISGAHLNPAVTVTLALFRGFSWSKVAPYALAQTLGAFVAALLVRWNYTEVIAKFDPATRSSRKGSSPRCPATAHCRSAPAALCVTRSSALQSCCSASWPSPTPAAPRRPRISAR